MIHDCAPQGRTSRRCCTTATACISRTRPCGGSTRSTAWAWTGPSAPRYRTSARSASSTRACDSVVGGPPPPRIRSIRREGGRTQASWPRKEASKQRFLFSLCWTINPNNHRRHSFNIPLTFSTPSFLSRCHRATECIIILRAHIPTTMRAMTLLNYNQFAVCGQAV